MGHLLIKGLIQAVPDHFKIMISTKPVFVNNSTCKLIITFFNSNGFPDKIAQHFEFYVIPIEFELKNFYNLITKNATGKSTL